MTLNPGTFLGPYEIQSVLGAGGMGEVYRARDTRLNRVVAIKVLPSGLAVDSRRRERFEREARVISSLNHSHICTLFDVGHQDGVDYLVMELLDGQTLADRIARGALPIDQALACAIEIAGALDLAHRRGVVHRDLKPANIMLTRSGAKLLDFGIATAAESAAGSATAQATLTEAGVLLGTPQYMAPEQLEGRAADARADLFAFGAVLYEMLTGRRAFPGQSPSQLIAAVLDSKPAPLDATTPPELDHLVMTCLAKTPDERWQSAGDLRRQLEWIASNRRTGAVPATTAQRSSGGTRATRLAGAGALLLLAAALSLAWVWALRRTQPALRETRLEISTPRTAEPWSMAISPDGLAVAFVAESNGQPALWVRPLDREVGRPLPDTDDATLPFWSPDSKSIGFFAKGKLKRIDVKGGGAQGLADAAQPQGATWSRDGSILFSPHQVSPLLRVPASGGAVTPVTTLAPGHVGHLFPQLLQDGRHVLFFVAGAPDVRGAYVGQLDGTSPRRLMDVSAPAVFLAPRHLLVAREDGLFAQPLDTDRFELTGTAVRVADQVNIRTGYGGSDLVALAASEAGDIAYRGATVTAGSQLTWFDRAGNKVAQIGAPDATRIPGPLSLSPDARRVVVSRRIDGKSEIWLVDLERNGAMSRLILGDPGGTAPLWSRDASRIVFATTRNGPLDLYQRSVDSPRPEALHVTSHNKVPAAWSPDGLTLLYLDADPKSHLDVWALPVGAEKPFPVVQSANEDINPDFSPDGAWLAYQSNESNRHEVYARRFRGAGAPLLISTAGGSQPRWRADGKELFYLALDGRLMSVSIAFLAGGRSLQAGIPTPLFQTAIGGPAILQRQYEVSPDGQRFLMDVPIDAPLPPIILIQHWTP